jgi:hypothetical protein
MHRRLQMIRSASLVVLSLFADTPSLGAQALRVDLTAANRHLWRGVNRTTARVGQIHLAAVAPLGPGALAVGVFESRELSQAGGGELTEVGLGRKGLGERDWWLEYRAPVGSQEIFAGVTRYTFHGNRQLGGRSSGDNTTEVSLGAQSKLTYLSPALAVHWDVEKVKGVYLEASGALPLLGWPFPPQVNVYLDAALGLSFGQGPDAAHPEQMAYYAGDGFTHLATGLSVDLRQGEHFTAAMGARVQAGIDDEAHRGSNGRRRNLFVACWAGTTLRLGRLQ